MENTLFLPSHSHTSLEMMALNDKNIFNIPNIGIYQPELLDFVVNKLAALIEAADKDLKPVKVGTGQVILENTNHNRRNDAFVDRELTVTRVDLADGKPLAVLINWTAHPTFMSSEDMWVSAGWPGYLQRDLAAWIGDGVMVMYYNGAQGDQTTVGRPAASGGSRWENAAQFGLELGLLAAGDWKDVPLQQDMLFDFHLQTIDLPERRWHPDFMSTGGKEYGLSESLLRDMLPRMFPDQTISGSLRLGDLVIVGIPGEMSAELGLKVKAETKRITGAAHPVIGGLANEWVSYILTAAAYRTGGYEAGVSFYGETLGQTIRDGALAGVGQLEK